MVNVLEERSSASSTKIFLYHLHSMGGNSYSLNVVSLKCTTTTETLVMQCTIFLCLSLVYGVRPTFAYPLVLVAVGTANDPALPKLTRTLSIDPRLFSNLFSTVFKNEECLGLLQTTLILSMCRIVIIRLLYLLLQMMSPESWPGYHP